MTIQVQHILKTKGDRCITVAPGNSVAYAVDVLRKHRIGAVIVSADAVRIEGILSERDIVHALAEHGQTILDRPVSDLMTRQVVTCRREDGVLDLLGVMTGRRFRHMPVVDEDHQLVGVVSIGDLVKGRLDQLEHESQALKEFIAGY